MLGRIARESILRTSERMELRALRGAMDFWVALLNDAVSIGSKVPREPFFLWGLLSVALLAGGYSIWGISRRRRDERRRAASQKAQRDNVLFGTPIEPKHVRVNSNGSGGVSLAVSGGSSLILIVSV